MSGFVDFNQRVLGKPPKENKFLTDLKVLLESTKAALDKEQTNITVAKKETAVFADEVHGLKEKISIAERVGLERRPSASTAIAAHERPELESMEQAEIPNDERSQSLPSAPVVKQSFKAADTDVRSKSLVYSTINKQNPRVVESGDFQEQSRLSEMLPRPSLVQNIQTESRTKDDTLLTLVKTNAALSRQLEELRLANREQERAYFELLKFVDVVTSALIGDIPLTKPTAFYIEERQRSLVVEIKSLNDKLKSMTEVNASLLADLEAVKAAVKKSESEVISLKSRLSISESQNQLTRSERDRAASDANDLRAQIEKMRAEAEVSKERYALELSNLREDFKRKFKATVWNQSSALAGSAVGKDKGDVQMVVWLDESAGIEEARRKLAEAAAARDLSSMLAVMSAHNDRTLQSATLQEYACTLVAQLAADEANHADLIASELLDAALEAMRQHLNSLVVQRQGIRLLNSVGVVEAGKPALTARCVGCAVQVLRVYCDDDPQLLAACLAALCNLCSDESIPEIIEAGLEDVLRVMRRHPAAGEVQRAAYEALHILSSDDANAKVIGERCLIEIIETMRQQEADEGLQESACSVLCNLARDEENRGVIMELGLADLLSAMRRHKGSAGVQEKACAALGNLAADENNTAAIAEEGLPDILEAISRHMDRASVVQYACTALWYLTTSPAQLARIAEYGMDLILTAVTRHMRDAEVVGQACGALLNLSLDPRSRELMMSSGCAQTMRAVVAEQAGHPEIPPLANRILTQLKA